MIADLDNLVRLTKSQVKPAARVLARVFQDEPVYVYFVPDASQRKNKLHYHFALRLRYAVSCGEVYATSPNLEGIAIWFPHGYTKMTPWTIIRSGGFSVGFHLGRKSASRQAFINDYLHSIHMRHAPFPHWYLSSLGVAPVFQGKGYARNLLKPMLARIDEEHLPCYLETQKETNISLYRHYGFEVVGETIIPGTQITNWAMLKKKSG